MSLPLVSLCIPTYNGAFFVAAAVRSALAQTYPHLEILIADDDSQDDTLAIAAACCEGASVPVRLLSHPRYGLVENWNYCVREARGEYIKFLFQDDLLDADCVENLVAIAIRDPDIGLVFCRRRLLSDLPIPETWQWLQDLHRAWSHLQPQQRGLDMIADPRFLQQPDNKIGEPTNVLLRRTALMEVGDFDANFRQFCDWEMWVRLMTRYQVAFCDRELASFRLHVRQTTRANLAQDTIWSEIYRVWLKIVVDPRYGCVPAAHRQQIRRHALRSLLRESLRSIARQRWRRLGTIGYLICVYLTCAVGGKRDITTSGNYPLKYPT